MRIPLPARIGSRTRSCGASGGGKAPSSGGSVARTGAEQGDPSSFTAVTGRQSGAVESGPLTRERMVLSAASSPRRSASRPLSSNSAPSASMSAR